MPRSRSYDYDAVIIGAGPNGLAAAITLAQEGWSVLLLEAKDTIGGGSRSAELTLPGFVHDVCSAIHPLGTASPLFLSLPLDKYGLHWIHPDAPLAHPFDDGTAAVLERSIEATCATLGRDRGAYYRLISPIIEDWDKLVGSVLGPLRLPSHPIALARFGLNALRSAKGLAEATFKGQRARSLFAGIAAHSMLSLDQPVSAAAGLVLGSLAHISGWPMPRGGSQQIVNAMALYLKSLGGEIATGVPVQSIRELPSARARLFDVTPRQLLSIAGDCFPPGYRKQLEHYRYGPGAFKIDYALDSPVPWKAKECARAGTVHLGGTLPELVASERAIWKGKHARKPFVLVAQQSLFDATRAPQGKHTLWAYCHVPNGSPFSMTERIEAQIERFAPGFKDLVLARHITTPSGMERYNPNYLGGDIGGGIQDIRQLFTRPVVRPVPYSTPAKDIYICSSSTPPGGGVHGLCGYFAARAALKSLHNKEATT